MPEFCLIMVIMIIIMTIMVERIITMKIIMRR